MQATIRNLRDIKTSTDQMGNTHRGRQVLFDMGDGEIADWKYVGDEVFKPEDLKVGMKVNFLKDSKGWITVVDKV